MHLLQLLPTLQSSSSSRMLVQQIGEGLMAPLVLMLKVVHLLQLMTWHLTAESAAAAAAADDMAPDC
jgi:hypothetical protein